MKPAHTTTAACLIAALLAGCGYHEPPQPAAARRYPALNESPPPPMPRIEEPPPPPAVEIKGDPMGDSWLERQMRSEATIKSLRDYTANAADDDQLKLSTEEINELEKNPEIGLL